MRRLIDKVEWFIMESDEAPILGLCVLAGTVLALALLVAARWPS